MWFAKSRYADSSRIGRKSPNSTAARRYILDATFCRIEMIHKHTSCLKTTICRLGLMFPLGLPHEPVQSPFLQAAGKAVDVERRLELQGLGVAEQVIDPF